VNWKWGTPGTKGHNDGGKPIKVPVDAKTGQSAKVNDPATWLLYKEAKCYHEDNSSFAGIDFMFSASNPYVGIDLDNCRNAETGEQAPWGQELIKLVNSYSEVSPSGTGVKMFVKGTMPGKTGCKKAYETGAVEMYMKNRFFTVTGEYL